MNLETRTAQLLAVTEADREVPDSTNPIVYAEQGPSRFATMTLFFSDDDGVTIEEDTDLNVVTVKYWNAENRDGTVLEEGDDIYDWAVQFFNDNWAN